MIEIEHRIIKGIPVLELVERTLKDSELPTVFFYHGWDCRKENVLLNGYELAKRGIRAVLPEALFHGERQDEKETVAHHLDFWLIVKQNIKEFPIIKEYYIERNLAAKERIGVSGVSMGGITTCAMVASYADFKGAVCLMGSPSPRLFARKVSERALDFGFTLPQDIEEQTASLISIDLSSMPEKITNRPFHFWHGSLDEMVPYQETYDFYQSIKGKEYAKNVTFKTTHDSHTVPFSISVEMAEFFLENL